MRVYLEFGRKSFQKMLQYRTANLAGMATNLFFGAVRVLIFTAFYQASTAKQPLSLHQVATYVWLSQSFLMVIRKWGRPEVSDTIRDGSVAMQLTKPVDFQFYWLADEFGKSTYFLLMRALPSLLFSIFLFRIMIPADPLTWLAFLTGILLAVVLNQSYIVAAFASTFWTLDATGVGGFCFALQTFFSGFVVPIALWPDWLQQIASRLPFEGMINFPFSIYLGEVTGVDILVGFGKQILWIAFFVCIGRWGIRRGLTKLVLQGG